MMHVDKDLWGSSQVLNGSYDVPGLEFKSPPTILDVGANVGCASLWFSKRYPGCKVHAYEPTPACILAFLHNLSDFPNVELHQCGVLASCKAGDSMPLYEGICGTYSNSFYWQPNEQNLNFVTAKVFPAEELPEADILKVDTEGCDSEIIENYKHIDNLSAVMYEWHTKADERRIKIFLSSHGFRFVKYVPSCNTRGDVIALGPKVQ